jgi:hypothetical protein
MDDVEAMRLIARDFQRVLEAVAGGDAPAAVRSLVEEVVGDALGVEEVERLVRLLLALGLEARASLVFMGVSAEQHAEGIARIPLEGRGDG